MHWRLSMLIPFCLVGCATTNDERWRSINEDGVQLFGKAEYRQALNSFDYALTLRPQDPVIIYNTAQCYDRLGDVKKAEELYAYCLQRDSKHGDARLVLIALKYRSGRGAEANQQILEWLKQEPNSADVHVADAWRLRQDKAYPLAQSRLQHARSLEPHNRRVLTEMAVLCELQGMPERSLVLYEDILTREPSQVEIANRVAQLKARGVKAPLPN